jgi:hypothetical protein
MVAPWREGQGDVASGNISVPDDVTGVNID